MYFLNHHVLITFSAKLLQAKHSKVASRVDHRVKLMARMLSVRLLPYAFWGLLKRCCQGKAPLLTWYETRWLTS